VSFSYTALPGSVARDAARDPSLRVLGVIRGAGRQLLVSASAAALVFFKTNGIRGDCGLARSPLHGVGSGERCSG
jgi:hypothetical protein